MQQPEIASTDVLILGGGLAGFRAAVAARKAGATVTIAHFAKGASPYILGCDAALAHQDPRDAPQHYFDDVVRGGYGLNDRRLVDQLSKRAADGVRELSAIGVPFHMTGENFTQRQLAGNWYPRSVFHPEGLGILAMQRLAAYAKEIGITQISGVRATSLLEQDGEVCGALLYEPRKQQLLAVGAKSVVIALGGIGQVYADSTYPVDVTGVGYGLAYDAGATLIDMEFVQFEPLVAVSPKSIHGLELPTSFLVEGGRLLNSSGERFMFKHNPEHGEGRVEKARLSLCIQDEIDAGRDVRGGIVYDLRHVPEATLTSYARHYRQLINAGVDPAKDEILVRPAAHSQMGGVQIDQDTWSGVPGLFVAGETAGGLHGASRIAGNGSSDALVFGALAGEAAARVKGASRDWAPLVRTVEDRLRAPEAGGGGTPIDELKKELRATMSARAGIRRTGAELAHGIEEVAALSRRLEKDAQARTLVDSIAVSEVRHMITTGFAILSSAEHRTESRGAHQRRDFPATDEAWLTHIAARRGRDGQLEINRAPVQ